MSVHLSPDVFARLIGRKDHGVMLFEVASEFVNEEWSQPVRFRFVRTTGGLLTMELQSLPYVPGILPEAMPSTEG